jgi:hypothetical protein
MTLTESSKVSTSGNVYINKYMSLNAPLNVRQGDTIAIVTTDTGAIFGKGYFNGGTVKRAIASGSTSTYRFESPVTTVRFYPGGTTPSQVLLTSFPKFTSPLMPDSIYVKRYYVGTAIGGSNYKATVFLRYSEDESYLSPYDVAFFKDSSGFLINIGNSDFIDEEYMATGLDSVKEFITWYLGDASVHPKHPQEFVGNFTVTDNGAETSTLTFGALKNATIGLDPSLGEIQLGAKPPSGTFDARWILPAGIPTAVDYRPFTENSHVINTYTCEIQPGAGGYPIQLQWNLQSKADGIMFLIDSATGGTKLNLNMKTQSSVTITDATITTVQIVQKIPFYVNMLENWNIASLPLNATTSSLKKDVFRNAISLAFKYNNGYTAEDILKNGLGYWLKYYRAEKVGLEGTPRLVDSISVTSGWNMIGSISNPVAVGNVGKIPSDMTLSSFFGYAGGYNATDSIRSGKGYWIKTNKAGKLILSSSGFAKQENELALTDFSRFSKIIVRDAKGGAQSLYLTNESVLSQPLSEFELPPVPPTDAFDARFTSNSMVELLNNKQKTTSRKLVIQSNSYPVTIQCEGVGNEIQFITVSDAERGTRLGTIMADGKSSLRIDNPAITKVELIMQSGAELPKVFSLDQNYPNPFNPSTQIQFNLPEPVTVTLQLYNVLGQEVATLLNNTLYEPGSYVTTWNAVNFSSGMYFYRLTARKQTNGDVVFQDVKKLLLMK